MFCTPIIGTLMLIGGLRRERPETGQAGHGKCPLAAFTSSPRLSRKSLHAFAHRTVEARYRLKPHVPECPFSTPAKHAKGGICG